jgi:6-phosphogluconate dehydrogenase
MKSTKTDIGLIGLGVMGANIVRNIASRGFKVSVYNRSLEVTKKFIKDFGSDDFVAAKNYKGFIMSIKKPRTIFILVTAGAPVDYVIKDLLKHLDKGDTIIDGGNSFYKDTQRREKELAEKGIHFMGCGVSGGEEGALHGPSLMPGGTRGGYKGAKKILESIAAKDFSDGPCVAYVGDNGAGHYVKMVHNGIEYGIMQLIAESYDVLTKVYKLSPDNIADIFEKFNKGRLKSFLVEITVPVLRKMDDKKGKSGALIDKILDQAGNKGTGKWTSQDALDRGVAIPTITQAVYARYLSAAKEKRVELHRSYKPTYGGKKLALDKFVKLLEKSLFLASLSSYSQGFDLISAASKDEKWNINLAEVSRIWEGGCIIRATVLKNMHDEFGRKKSATSLLDLPFMKKSVQKDAKALRQFVGYMSELGVPALCYSSSLYYIQTMIEKRGSANMIQGQRDYFGAHTFKRVDKKGTFHAKWDE